jgi:ABC-type glutathione transport system ATPase component
MTDLSVDNAMNDLSNAVPMQRIAVPSSHESLHTPSPVKLAARGLDFYYDKFHALKGINLEIPEKRVTALIGPSGCGKSTLLRIFNRIYALYPKLEARGEVLLDGENILSPKYPMNRLRSKVGMVFQKPVPFPMTIFENVAYGIRHHEKLSKADMADRVEQALRQGALWDEVKDKLGQSAGPVRRPAAAPVHRPCRGAAPVGAAAGRADLGAGPDLDQPHRAAGGRAQARVHHRHRHPQHAAGRARVRLHRLHVPGRPDRARPHRSDLLAAVAAADRGLHHRSLRLIDADPSPHVQPGTAWLYPDCRP